MKTLALSKCADNSIVSKKLNKKCGSNFGLLPVFKALCRAVPEQNAGPIHEFNQAPQGDNPPVQFGAPLFFKALCRDNPCVQSRTPPCF